MKARLLAAGFMAVLALGSAAADGLKVKGYAIYSDFLGIQTFRTTPAGTDDSGITVKKEQWWNFKDAGGRAQLDFSYSQGDVFFLTTFRLDEANLTNFTSSKEALNPLNTAHVAIRLLEGQARFRTGMFQEEGFGYDMNGYASGIWGRYLASNHGGATDTLFLTALELMPDEVPGLSVLLGLPIGPYGYTYPTAAQTELPEGVAAWTTNTLNRFRVAFKYDYPVIGLIRGFWYNGLWGTGKEGKGLNEYFLGLENLFFYDLQYKVAYELQNDLRSSKDAFAHTATLSTLSRPLPAWTLKADGSLFAFNKEWALGAGVFDYGVKATDALWADGKWGLVSKVVVVNSLDLKPFELGLLTSVFYEPFSNGHMDLWGQPHSALVNNDVNRGNEVAAVANPYFKYAIGQGTVTVGLEVMFNSITVGSTTNRTVGWRLPVDLFFWF